MRHVPLNIPVRRGGQGQGRIAGRIRDKQRAGMGSLVERSKVASLKVVIHLLSSVSEDWVS